MYTTILLLRAYHLSLQLWRIVAFVKWGKMWRTWVLPWLWRDLVIFIINKFLLMDDGQWSQWRMLIHSADLLSSCFTGFHCISNLRQIQIFLLFRLCYFRSPNYSLECFNNALQMTRLFRIRCILECRWTSYFRKQQLLSRCSCVFRHWGAICRLAQREHINPP